MSKFLLRSFSGYHDVDSLDPRLVGDRKAGTLGYTMWGLIAVLILLCIGSAGFLAVQVVVVTLLPKQFSDAGASNKIIAFFITTMPYAVTMVVTPIASFKSDRTRTRRGRRIPYLIGTVPVIAFFCLLIGWAEFLGVGVRSFLPACLAEYSTLAVLAVLAVAYNVFFMIPGAVFWYLFPDVIPSHFLGRFMSGYQLIASLTGFVINTFFLKYADTQIQWLYTAIALFFFISMFVMILCVREGRYPEPEKNERNVPFYRSAWNSAVTYCKECYSIPFYYWFFTTMALSEVSMICRNMFVLIYAQKQLGISTGDFGKIMGWYGIVGVFLSIPLGYICDRIGALKVFASGLLLVVVINICSFYWVHDYRTFYITTILLGVVYTIQMVSTIPVFVAILPKEFYGQFCSANALFRAIFMAIGGFGGGVLFDFVQDYQYIYLWDFMFTLAALISFIVMYIGWKRRGGAKGYVAPVKKGYHTQNAPKGNGSC